MDARVPISVDGCANESLDEHDGKVVSCHCTHENICDHLRRLEGTEDADDDEQERYFCKVRVRSIDDGIRIKGLSDDSTFEAHDLGQRVAHCLCAVPSENLCTPGSRFPMHGSLRRSGALSYNELAVFGCMHHI